MNTASIHNDDNADPRLEHNLATKVTIKSADMGSTMTRKLPNESENRHQDNHLEPHSGSDSDHLSTFRRPAPSSKADSNASLLEPSDSVRRSRSGRPLRSTVQQNDPSRRSSSAEAPESIGKRTRSFTSSRVGASGCDPQDRLTEKSGLNGEDITDAPLPSGDERGAQMDSRSESSSTNGNGDRRQYAPEGTEEMGSEEDQDEDYADDGEEGANEEGADSTSTTTTKNEDGSESLVVSMYGSPSLVKVRSMFIDKLYKMVEDSAIQHLIAWAKDGDMFYVFNCIELSASVLPKFFKHNNWQSFVRQLNMYGFHKIYRYDRGGESTCLRFMAAC
ncbi:hypothetical protein BGW38_005172 [Lunasporangiospora selenospora]|uniref:HSF-type DNA-binding domain-containing protein n=1 Tax=Lunasporangiospora selenospora TaxID=979761 RepID=A0A9P6FNC2_9FUNG|nr:hypothetical protein BGW38_005172 [Lunasporangiospora selenospora]